MGPFFLPARASLARKAADNARVMTSHRPPYRRLAVALAIPLLLSACEIPGLGPSAQELQREAEAQAIGGACRHAMRGLEDCFTLNPKAPKAAVYAGWKEMDAYMRENKLEGTPSVITKADPAAEAKRRRRKDPDDEEV